MKRLIKMLPIFLIPLMFTGCGKEEVTYRTLSEIKGDGTINIAFSNEYDKASASSYTIYIILGIAVVILFIVLKKIRKANSV